MTMCGVVPTVVERAFFLHVCAPTPSLSPSQKLGERGTNDIDENRVLMLYRKTMVKHLELGTSLHWGGGGMEPVT